MPGRAFITGITGQTGSYLAELLLDRGYEVTGLMRRSSTLSTERIARVYDHPSLRLVYGDVLDEHSLRQALIASEPTEVYNLAAQSHVRLSFDMPVYTTEVVALGTLRLLESIRALGMTPRIYQASSSEMFGNSDAPQSESSRFDPRSPYAIAKVSAHQTALHYRDAHQMAISCGILFNHESERRGETFVTRKISQAAARISLGKQKTVKLGNLAAKRDWGYAPEYAEAMWKMLQHDRPDDFVVATGETHSVEEFAELAFRHVGLDYRMHVEYDARFERPSEVHVLCGYAQKAKAVLGWEPATRFADLVRTMVEHDVRKEGGGAWGLGLGEESEKRERER